MSDFRLGGPRGGGTGSAKQIGKGDVTLPATGKKEPSAAAGGGGRDHPWVAPSPSSVDVDPATREPTTIVVTEAPTRKRGDQRAAIGHH